MRKIKILNLLLIIIIGAMLFLDFELWLSHRNKVSDAEANLLSAKNNVKSLELKLVELRKTRDEFEMYQRKLSESDQKLTKLEGLLPEKLEVSSIIREIVTLSKKTQIRLGKINPKNEPVPGELVDSLGVSFDFQGSYKNAVAFLDQLSLNSSFFNIRKMIVNAADDGQSDNVAVQIEIDYFKRREKL